MKKLSLIFGVLALVVFMGAMCESTTTNTNTADVNVPPANLNEAIGTEECKDTETGNRMTYEEAVKIADASECTKEGTLKSTYMCNDITGTWWIDLDVEKEGCSPACVVNVNDKTAEINWRCTGLLPEEE
ncbi:hypothetical protein KKC88_01175 [Patescibacteria group bacterium]|nr:hypothetical protein [Patescibacteria group bacterium]MBU1672843.1 hypothetical protein [Patescibacteria group bacterium]MBU1963736.1 hypothetical protein [Patescibacteria group bacterium]